jgi:hypothetical protein
MLLTTSLYVLKHTGLCITLLFPEKEAKSVVLLRRSTFSVLIIHKGMEDQLV